MNAEMRDWVVRMNRAIDQLRQSVEGSREATQDDFVLAAPSEGGAA